MIAAAPTLTALKYEPVLLEAIDSAVSSAIGMCGVSTHCVGVSTVPPSETGIITGLIGVHGKVTGFVTVNMAERFATKAVEGLLQDSFTSLSAQVVDGLGEITNVIGGGIKAHLASTPWGFTHITVPSVIVGKGYAIAYAKGLEFLSVQYVHNDPEAIRLEDRQMQVSISLLRL
jgi:chemotaxis protein CheX